MLFSQHITDSNYYLFELFFLLRMMAMFVSDIAYSMLLQDKICLHEFNQSALFCANIHHEQEEVVNSTNEDFQNRIFAESTRFSYYQNTIELIPMFTASWFVGPFLDQYPQATYILLFSSVISSLFAHLVYMANAYFYALSPYYILVASLSAWLSGGYPTFWSTTYYYLTMHSSEKGRSIKFAVLDIVFVLGHAPATYLSGKVLKVVGQEGQVQGHEGQFQGHEGHQGQIPGQIQGQPQLRNYMTNYYITLGLWFATLGCLFLLYRFDKKKSAKSESKSESKSETNKSVDTKPSLLHSLFDLENVRLTFATFIKPRARNIRAQMMLLCGIVMCQLIAWGGIEEVVFLRFAQKVFHWSTDLITDYSALATVVSTVIFAAVSYLLVSRLELSDSSLIAISHLSVLLSFMSVGTFLTETAYFVSLPLGALWNYSFTCTRSKISKLIPHDEIGKIFSCLSTLETLTPLLTSMMYSELLNLTIDTRPGMVYHFSAAIIVLSFLLNVGEGWYFEVKGQSEKEDDIIVNKEGQQIDTKV